MSARVTAGSLWRWRINRSIFLNSEDQDTQPPVRVSDIREDMKNSWTLISLLDPWHFAGNSVPSKSKMKESSYVSVFFSHSNLNSDM